MPDFLKVVPNLCLTGHVTVHTHARTRTHIFCLHIQWCGRLLVGRDFFFFFKRVVVGDCGTTGHFPSTVEQNSPPILHPKNKSKGWWKNLGPDVSVLPGAWPAKGEVWRQEAGGSRLWWECEGREQGQTWPAFLGLVEHYHPVPPCGLSCGSVWLQLPWKDTHPHPRRLIASSRWP